MPRTRTLAEKAPFRQKEPDRRALTSDRIADDLEAFRLTGGRIEVLGTTRVLKKLDATPEAPGTQPVKPTPPANRRKA